MVTLASNAARSDVYAYILAVRDGTRTLTTPPTFPTTAFSRSSDSTEFTVALANYRSDAMSYTISIGDDAASQFELLGSASGTCAAGSTTCSATGRLRFTPNSAPPSAGSRATATLVVTSRWISVPSEPSTASTRFDLSADAVDAFVVTTPAPTDSVLRLTTSSTAPTASEPVKLTDNTGDAIQVCLRDGVAPYNGIAAYTIAIGASASGNCLTFAAASGVIPPGRQLEVNVTFSPGTSVSPLNAGLEIVRLSSGVPTGMSRPVRLQGNAGAVIGVMPQRLFTAIAREVDGIPSSVDQLLIITSRGNAPLTLSASPFQLLEGRLSGTTCEPPLADSTTASSDYDFVQGGCTALSGLPAWNGTNTAETQCSLTLRFDPNAPGLRCSALRIRSDATEQTVLLEGMGFFGPRLSVLESAVLQATGVLLNFTTQRIMGDAPPPRLLTLRNVGSIGRDSLEIALPSPGAMPGFNLTTSGSCTTLAPYDASASGPECLVSVAFAPTERRPYSDAFEIRTRAAGSSAAFSAFRVNVTGVGSDTAPALQWQHENRSGTEVTSLTFDKEARVACADGCVRRVQLRNLGPGSARIELAHAVGTDGLSWRVQLEGCTSGQFIPERDYCQVAVFFEPTTAGAKTATLQAVSTGNGPPTLTLLGTFSTGSASPSLEIASAGDFSPTRVGSRSAPVEVRIANYSGFPVTVLAMTTTGPFVLQGGGCPALPFVLYEGSGCTVSVSFTPTSGGTTAGSLEIASDVSSTAYRLALSGSADAPADLSSGGCSLIDGATSEDPTLWVLVDCND